MSAPQPEIPKAAIGTSEPKYAQINTVEAPSCRRQSMHSLGRTKVCDCFRTVALSAEAHCLVYKAFC